VEGARGRLSLAESHAEGAAAAASNSQQRQQQDERTRYARWAARDVQGSVGQASQRRHSSGGLEIDV
jgi:hypothetical protein